MGRHSDDAPEKKRMSKTIILTGATGTVSSPLVAQLQASPAVQVRALVRSEASATKLRAAGVQVVLGDLDDPDSLPAAFEGADELWQLTPPGPRAPENAMNALWAARRAGVKRVVRMSAIGAAHDAPTRNGRLHALSDAELQASGLRWTILRPHFFMQNLLGFASSIAADGTFYMGMGQGRLGFVDTRDISDVAARLFLEPSERHDGKIYTLTGPESLSLTEAAERLSQVLERPVRYIAVPDEAARAAMLQMGMSPWLTGMTIEYGRAYAAGWGDFTTSHVSEVLGRAPRSFTEFAREQWPRPAV
jgi:uncharacterized protein YbjT (DUF2867 family)